MAKRFLKGLSKLPEVAPEDVTGPSFFEFPPLVRVTCPVCATVHGVVLERAIEEKKIRCGACKKVVILLDSKRLLGFKAETDVEAKACRISRSVSMDAIDRHLLNEYKESRPMLRVLGYPYTYDPNASEDPLEIAFHGEQPELFRCMLSGVEVSSYARENVRRCAFAFLLFKMKSFADYCGPGDKEAIGRLSFRWSLIESRNMREAVDYEGRLNKVLMGVEKRGEEREPVLTFFSTEEDTFS